MPYYARIYQNMPEYARKSAVLQKPQCPSVPKAPVSQVLYEPPVTPVPQEPPVPQCSTSPQCKAPVPLVLQKPKCPKCSMSLQ